MWWATDGETGIPPPPEFTLIRAAEVLNCSVFELLRQPLRWRKMALLYAAAQDRYPKVKKKIDDMRGRMGGDAGESEEDEDD